jgi:hypothetical protein
MWARCLAILMTVAAAVAGLSACGGDDELTAAQRTAYERILEYEKRAPEILVGGQPRQQAAARALRENVKTLKGAGLGEEADAALDTIASTPHKIDNPDRPEPGRAARRQEALATLKDAVAGRVD